MFTKIIFLRYSVIKIDTRSMFCYISCDRLRLEVPCHFCSVLIVCSLILNNTFHNKRISIIEFYRKVIITFFIYTKNAYVSKHCYTISNVTNLLDRCRDYVQGHNER